MNLNVKSPLEKTPISRKDLLAKSNSYYLKSVLMLKNMEKDRDEIVFDKLTFNSSRSVWDGFLLISANKIPFATSSSPLDTFWLTSICVSIPFCSISQKTM